MPTLPPLHARLVLRHDDREWPSRVEAVDGSTLTVARPFDLPTDGGPQPGSSLALTWTHDSGAYTLPVRLAESRRDGIVPLWVVTPDGEATRAQRRAHFRLGLAAQAQVTTPAAPEPLTAHLVDASEAALRLRLDPSDAEQLRAGTPVTAAFGVREERFEVPGAVLRARPSRRSSGEAATDVVVTLDLVEAQARELRRALMAEQVRQRRLATD